MNVLKPSSNSYHLLLNDRRLERQFEVVGEAPV